MKKICLVFSISIFAMACSNNNAKDTAKADQHMKMDAHTASNNPHAKTDPVCGMAEGDIAYTDFSVYQSDTTWFCSPHCKESFDKDPAKYVKK
jgi:YHS domain-containing protein